MVAPRLRQSQLSSSIHTYNSKFNSRGSSAPIWLRIVSFMVLIFLSGTDRSQEKHMPTNHHCELFIAEAAVSVLRRRIHYYICKATLPRSNHSQSSRLHTLHSSIQLPWYRTLLNNQIFNLFHLIYVLRRRFRWVILTFS